ncbi:MAG: prepilin-type N-terminal cleavage/methylation domain-containing protein [Alphaproteobacteria bacterium]|nr:prepilin-type N-terminal cleavage/methylation domain-containing protein [Alphaproteobacteria bacterium]
MITRKTKAESRLEHRKKGFTLTEIAIVLGIMGLILGAIWTAASSVYTNMRTTHADTAVMQIVQGTRALFASSQTTGYGAATNITTQLVSAGTIPTDLISGATVVGPFANGSTGVIATSDGNGFVVVMTAVPPQNCIGVLTGVGGSSADPGLFAANAAANAAISAADATTTGTPLQQLATPITVTPTIAAAAVAGTAPSTYGGCTGQSSYKIRLGFTLK